MSQSKNKFGELRDLGSESSVEQFFVNRLLTDLGYHDSQVKPKASLESLTLSRGRKKIRWRPDYALLVDGKVRWILEAKAVQENLDDWVGQASSYCLELNRQAKDNPVDFFVLTNGLTTRLYRWDSDSPLVEASFPDFVDGNQAFDEFREILSPDALGRQRPVDVSERHRLRHPSVAELNADFAWAHRTIYRREALSYTAAFMEFVKVIFLKLKSDREVHQSNEIRDESADTISVPAAQVKFSLRWIQDREADTANPLDEIQFRNIVKELEEDIAAGRKKRMFASDERLELSPETLKAIVGRLQSLDLMSLDVDLNGRMFESFLNSTLRGKDLGQFFTPRSVVKLATGLAQLRVGTDHVDRVIDACAGTGGFLIEALSDMSSKVSALPISELKKAELREYIAEQALIGVDVARDPALARIARINMYLHGDGGTSIYQLDALDKKVTRLANDPPELVQEKDEFRKRVSQGEKVIDGHSQGLVDVVLTNPPFAKEYDRSQANEARLLDDYELGFITDGGARRPVASLSSMVMFLERYYDLLAPGGRLVTVLDDGILGAPKHKRVREWIRKNWIVRAVVSLPGDAFQRSQARVKTSILVLEKKTDQTEDQPDVFMYYCTAVGVDDTPRQRSRPVDDENRLKANEEIANAVSLFKAFLNGDTVASAWRVPAAAISDRMDVKACLPESGALVDEWTREGLDVRKVSDMLGVVDETSKSVDTDFDFRILDTRNTDETITYLRVRYDGFCEAGDEAVTSDLSAQRFTRVREGDIVFSHINTVHGAVGIVPDWLEGTVVTNEYTVCRSTGTIPAEVLWALLRSPQARADLLLMSTGIGRTRVKWATIRDLRLPVPGTDAQKKLVAALNGATEAERAAARQRADATSTLQRTLRLQASDAYDIIAAFKPPR